MPRKLTTEKFIEKARNIHEGKTKCDKCKRRVIVTRLVYSDYLCEKCYEQLGGKDYKEALDELNGVTVGIGFPAPQLQTEGWK